MKELLSNKKKLSDMETIALTEGCSAVLTNKLPPKMNDLRSFTIPCSIGNHYLGKALCDMGASINLMQLSTFKKLGIGHMEPTTVTLQLVDRSLAQPERQIKDILVHVDKLVFSADFIILDYEVDKEVLIILGRPILATGRNLIGVYKCVLTMRLNKEHVTFSVFKSIQCKDKEQYHTIDVLDNLIKEEFNDQSTILSEEFAVTSNDELLDNCDNMVEVNNIKLRHGWQIKSLDLANRTAPIFKPSIDKAPPLEFKPLPTHIKYVFIGDNNTFPVIVSATMDANQEEKLVHILQQHKQDVACSITDIQELVYLFTCTRSS
ncbi:uncharacterized protein LOC105772045 [Gossypium raimondii]|uniref:uncharacterized protein LOC105772045 n=1 Tax=Gossypium raimondii TaxID=29730 RepID=UPI00063ABAA8|nr:uncharacterized protein LOC105772045 [Gossypium raimondii]